MLRILIAEDSFINRKYLLKLLLPLGECDIAVNGIEAVDAFSDALETKKFYDLVCLDITMPEMDGHETLAHIRALEEEYGIIGLDQVKVIMTTGANDHKTILASFRGGCESFLIKPIKEDKLFKELETLGLITTTQGNV